MIKRIITSQINRLKSGFPVIVVTGPRQSGKTTLIRKIFPNHQYFNLENPETLGIIESDPAGFINAKTKNVIFDEVQRFPQLVSYIQAAVEEQRLMGNFILSGSENLLLSEKINQSLAGRAAYINLLPLSMEELKSNIGVTEQVYEHIFTGFYPAIFDKHIQSIDYYDQYLATYVERDLKQISNITNLSLFRKFLALLAGRIGQLVNASSLANDVGVAVNTIESWISILEASYLVFRLQPYFENYGKRYIKSSKIYFTDTGLACRLLGLTSANEVGKHYLVGGLFENFIIVELKKHILNHSKSAKLYFFRDSNGNEVDLIIDGGLYQIPVEIKSGATFSPDYLKGLKYWKKLKSSKPETKKALPGFVIYNGMLSHQSQNYELLSWSNINKLYMLIK
ncbi:MAG: AAA family ATPase [Candidatus Pacebacteria bacterium CG10_big_fil_rev_8_21_14_0_10_42_12]|nr:ATP-binding protein [Candidatus Parcubacteria bacterium]NCS66761.1 ATP-binding protein [Candidatus Peregrinibacteria bacterium]PIR62712.1 MAG: AAA family ATPase [Candidatus Pacebacteria bacterium CG10_big_fil_rev_8_21_14_0_10_42_12]